MTHLIQLTAPPRTSSSSESESSSLCSTVYRICVTIMICFFIFFFYFHFLWTFHCMFYTINFFKAPLQRSKILTIFLGYYFILPGSGSETSNSGYLDPGNSSGSNRILNTSYCPGIIIRFLLKQDRHIIKCHE